MAPPFDAIPRTEHGTVAASVRAAIDEATRRIAPAWPLDRLAAVNPLWGLVDRPIEQAFAEVATLAGSRLLMPREWYARQWTQGRFERRHLAAAIEARGEDLDPDALDLQRPGPPMHRRALVTDVADEHRDLTHQMAWSEYVVGRISHVCASYFDAPEGTPARREGGLHTYWRDHAARDRGPELLMGFDGFREAVRRLPTEAPSTIALGLERLRVPPDQRADYLSALLMDVGGWAAWCAYLRWTARLSDADDGHIEELLAIRVAWELLLHDATPLERSARWGRAVASWPRADHQRESLAVDWVFQEALELAYCERLVEGLREGMDRQRPSRPDVQAAFCIDVRSEILRRSLESASGGRARTLGFAGFFGLPMEYQAIGASSALPQLPGLLAPSLQVTDAGADPATSSRRAERLDFGGTWRAFKRGAISTFTFVETTGLFYGAKLLSSTFAGGRAEPVADRAGLSARDHAARRPRLTGAAGGGPLAFETRVDVAEGILRAMSLTRDLAPLVALVGHGSRTNNNPVAAGLDCGACCGQSGTANARAVAALLNDPDVRAGLVDRGLTIPEDTHFVPGLHDTTTDRVHLFDTDEVPPSHRDRLRQLETWLEAAGEGARTTRAPRLGLGHLSGPALRRAIERRARDWSEVRPEWGLAGNASFVIAPRERSDHLDLEGRAFLHEYRWQEDEGFAILEALMTAPMLVTHWINFQYYASTVDNRRYGSGDKVLHNVVGGHIGVFEGNGGDLRVGLPLQCLHDGEDWAHTPLRLSVFIEAPASAIRAVIAKHATVRHLVDHGWIRLFQLDPQEETIRTYRDGDWHAASFGAC